MAALLASVTLLFIFAFAVKFSEHDSATYQKVNIDGYIYQSEKLNSLEDFLLATNNLETPEASAENFTTAMDGERIDFNKFVGYI